MNHVEKNCMKNIVPIDTTADSIKKDVFSISAPLN